MEDSFSEKQLEFVANSTSKINLAHGSVRSGKTVGTLFRFMQAVAECPDSQIWMIGHTSETIYQNAIRLIMESEQLNFFKPFCTWFGGNKRELKFRDKTISTLGAKNEGAIGAIQGKTFSLCYCDEMTLFPDNIIDMIDTRLSNPHSMLFASMNPSHPEHKLKKWIDKAEAGDPNYYALQFTLDDNPFLEQTYKDRIANSLSGLFYKRNYLGLWCLAEGAIFDFFDKKLHVVRRAPATAEYFVAGIDYGIQHNFACTIMGVNTGIKTQTGPMKWFEDEYTWDSSKMGRQKTNSELADDVCEFLEPYGVRALYIDPSALAFKVELRKRGVHTVDADNSVLDGISHFASEMRKGSLLVMEKCTTLIQEIQAYTWCPKAAARGDDEPVKKMDDQIDSARYVHYSHKVAAYNPYKHDPNEYLRTKYQITR